MKKLILMFLTTFLISHNSFATVELENLAEDKFKKQQEDNKQLIIKINEEIENILDINLEEYYVSEREVNKFIEQYYEDFLEVADKSFVFYDKEKSSLYNKEERDIKATEREIYIIDRRLQSNCNNDNTTSFCKRQIEDRQIALNKITTHKHNILEIDLFIEQQKLDNLHNLKKEAFIDRVNALIEKYKMFEKQRTNQEP